MTQRIIYLVDQQLSWYNYRRYGLEALSGNGYHVEAWDFGPFVFPQGRKLSSVADPMDGDFFRVFDCEKAALDAVSSLTPDCLVVIVLADRPKSGPLLSVYRALSKTEAVYCLLDINRVIEPAPLPPVPRDFKAEARELLKRLKRVTPKKVYDRLVFPPLRTLLWRGRSLVEGVDYDEVGIRPADFLFRAGGRVRFPLPAVYNIGDETEIIDVPSLDYVDYLEARKKPAPTNPKTAVFLDGDLPCLPYERASNPGYLRPEDYSPDLCRFFDQVEGAQKVRVLIAAHPIEDYDTMPDCYGGGEVVRARTAELVRDCRFV